MFPLPIRMYWSFRIQHIVSQYPLRNIVNTEIITPSCTNTIRKRQCRNAIPHLKEEAKRATLECNPDIHGIRMLTSRNNHYCGYMLLFGDLWDVAAVLV